jgi:pimeloyl-ACP methyl ester carboxylesterase
MARVTLNGCDTHFDVAGEGAPLLYIHGGFGGLGTGGREFAPDWLASFAESNMLITYDRRSAGRSASPPGRHTLSLFAEDALALLGHLEIERAVIWGNSGGVAIASQFALAYPQSTTALILTDGAPWFSQDPAVVDALRERIDILHSKGPEAAYAARKAGGTVGLTVHGMRTAGAPGTGSEGLSAIRDALAQVSREVRIDKYRGELLTYEAYLDFDITSRLAELRMPVLVVYGTADSAFPGVDWTPFVADLANYECTAIPGADHGVSNSPEVQSLVAGFIGRMSSLRT